MFTIPQSDVYSRVLDARITRHEKRVRAPKLADQLAKEIDISQQALEMQSLAQAREEAEGATSDSISDSEEKVITSVFKSGKTAVKKSDPDAVEDK